MRALLVLPLALTALAGCPDNSADGFPVRPGGGGPGGGQGGVDAREPDASGLVAGQVCVITDLRQWDTTTMCAISGVAGLTVTIGTAVATTADDGSFSIASPAPSAQRVVVTGAGIVASSTRYNAAAALIRTVAPTATHWAAVENDSGFVLQSGTGAAIIAITANGAVEPGATAALDPPIINNELYDSAASATGWIAAAAAGPYGKVLFHGVLPGTVMVTAVTADLQNTGGVTLPVAADQLAFDTVDIVVPPP